MVMRLEFCQDCRQRPDSERHVPRNRDVVLSVPIGRQPKVTAGLTRRVISEPRQVSSKSSPDTSRGSLTV